MPTATFNHRGEAIEHIPATDLPAGSVVIQGELVGIATQPIPAGHLGAIQLIGVFAVPRAAEPAIAAGTRLFWDAGTNEASSDSNGGTRPSLGLSVDDSPASAVRIRVLIGR